MASTPDSWSNIPVDLAGLVLRRLAAHVDRVRFAAVCPQWRSAARQVRLPPPLPLLALKEGDIFYSMPRGEPLHFAGCRTGFATACGKWLVYQRFRDLLLVDPVSGTTKTLPAPSSVHFPGDDESDDSSDTHDTADKGDDAEDSHNSALKGEDSEGGSAPFRVQNKDDGSTDGHDSADEGGDSEGSHDSAYEGDYYEDGSVYTDISEKQFMEVNNFEVIKLMECSPNLIAALFQGSEYSRIAVCRPGGSKWSVAWDLALWITDMAFYQGKLYVVDYDEDLLALDISVDDKTGDPRVSGFGRVININQFDNDRTLMRMLYLVESCGLLLLVRRRIFHKPVHGEGQIHTFAGQCEPDVSIFKADFGRSLWGWGRWHKVTTVPDNLAMFLGPCSRTVWMPQGDSPGNRVWFLDDYKDFHTWNQCPSSLSSGTSRVANPKPFSPLPMISWRGLPGKCRSCKCRCCMALPCKLMLLVGPLLQPKLLNAPCVSLILVRWPSGIRDADLLLDDYVVPSFVNL